MEALLLWLGICLAITKEKHMRLCSLSRTSHCISNTKIKNMLLGVSLLIGCLDLVVVMILEYMSSVTVIVIVTVI